jgi:subtilisin family serine protease
LFFFLRLDKACFSSDAKPSNPSATTSNGSLFHQSQPKQFEKSESSLGKIKESNIKDESPSSLDSEGSEVFEISCDGPRTRLQAALNEIFIPGVDGHPSEILEIPAAKNLQLWQKLAGEISPRAELVLYAPGGPRSDANARFLGNTFLIESSTEAMARDECEKKHWRFIRSLGDGGPFLVGVDNPLQALDVLRYPDAGRPLKIAGDFRRTVEKLFKPNDPLFGQQWHLLNSVSSANSFGIDLNVVSAWDLSRGANVTVGIADDGVQVNHPDLVANIASGLHYNWVGGDPNDPSPQSSTEYHGTALAGLVAARADNGLGVSGVAPSAKIAGLRVINSGTAKDSDLISMLKWKPDGIAVKNMSFSTSQDNGRGFGTISDSVKSALVWATENGRNKKGTVLVQANGNGNSGFVFFKGSGVYQFPFYSNDDSQWDEFANSTRVISVASINRDGQPAYFTEYGANISVCAPSSKELETPIYTTSPFTDGLVTTDLNSGYRTSSNPVGGTSASAALVSGVAALMLEVNPSLGWRDVKEILMQTANQPSTTFKNANVVNKTGKNFSYCFGAGLVDAKAALLAASEHQNLPPMITTSRVSDAKLQPQYGDSKGVSVVLPLTQDMRIESVDLTFSAKVVINFYTLVLYLKSPSGTEVRMNCLRGPIGGVIGGTDIHFTTPFFWGESGKGNWTVRAVDEAPGGGAPGEIYKTVSSVGLTWYGSTAASAPDNDAFEAPTVITQTGSSQSQSFSVNNTGATRQSKDGEPDHAGGKGGGSLWWQFIPTSNGLLTLDTYGSSVSDTLLGVYTGSTLKTLTVVANNDDASPGNLLSRISRQPVEAGKPVLIAVDGKNRARGTVKLNLSFQSAAIYDNFAEPKIVKGGSWADTRNSSASPVYSKETGEGPHSGQAANKSLWYFWTPDLTGTAEIWTANTTFPTVLAAYQGNTINQLTPVATDSTRSYDGTSRLQFGVRPGQTYAVVVDGRNRSSGTFTINGFVNGSPASPSNRIAPVTPSNQIVSSAISLSGAPVRVNGSNLNAARGTLDGPSVWYKWTPTKSSLATINLNGSSYDTLLGVYTESMTAVASNDNARSGVRWSQVSFSPSAGSTYMIEVSGARGASGQFVLNVLQ